MSGTGRLAETPEVPGEAPGTLEAWGRAVYRWRWATLLACVALMVATVVVLVRGGRLVPGTIDGTESDVALRLVQSQIDEPGASTFVVLFHHATLRVDDPIVRRGVEEAIGPLRGDPRVLSIETPYGPGGPGALVSADGRWAAAVVGLRDEFKVAVRHYPELRQRVRSGDLELAFTGNLALKHDIDRVLEADLRRAELVSLPLAILFLLIVFRSAVAAMLPVGVGALAVLGGVAGIFLLSRATQVAAYSVNVASLVGLGVAIDYSLLIVERFREELRAGHATEAALGRTLGTAGRAVAFSGLAVTVGLSGLLFFHGSYLAAMGIAGAIVVALAVLYSLTLLPALLAVLGPRVNALAIPLPGWADTGTAWRRLASASMRRPLLVAVPALAILVVMGLPFARLRLANADLGAMPEHTEAYQGHRLLSAHLPALTANRIVVVAVFPRDGRGLVTPERFGALWDLSARLRAIEGVSAVESVVDLGPRLPREQVTRVAALGTAALPPDQQEAIRRTTGENIAVLGLRTPHGGSSEEARRIVRAVRALRGMGDARLLVTGATAVDIDTIALVERRTPWAVAWTVLVTLLVLFAALRSVLLPIKAVAMNLLSISASFGALVWIFQDGHLAAVLGFRAGPIEPTLPAILFCTVFGLSMDYEVFLLARIKEEYARSRDNEQAVIEGLTRSGRLITSAAVIMVGVFSAFALADVVIIKALGVGMALAVAVDATVVRLLFVPAAMRLLGRWNWWPGLR